MSTERIKEYFLPVLLGGTFILVFFIFQPFLSPLILALVCAVVFQPLYTQIVRVCVGRRSAAAFLTVLFSALCIIVPLYFLSARIVSESQQLYTTLADESSQSYMHDTVVWVDMTVSRYVPQVGGFSNTVSLNLDHYLKQGLAWMIQHLGPAVSGLAGLFLSCIVFFMALFYLLRDGKEFKRIIVEWVPLPNEEGETIVRLLGLAVNSIVKGNLAIALIQGGLTALGFTIFGVPNAFLWGTLAAITALIPGFGTSLVLVPAVIYLYVIGNIPASVGLMMWSMIAVGLVDNFLGPKLVGRGMNLHPLLVLLAVLGGIVYFGPIGLFLGPLTLGFLFALISVSSSRVSYSQ